MDFLDEIKGLAQQLISESSRETRYRTPLIGCAAADDEIFARIRSVTHEGHLLPQDLLPGARSVVALFLPFHRDVVDANRRAEGVSREWAVAYVETNALISEICEQARAMFSAKGIRTAYEQPTHNFDTEKLVAGWSHRHAAYAAGLGTFGINNLLITAAGCAGRVCSFVVDVDIPPTPRSGFDNCLYQRNGTCRRCIYLCPVNALTKTGFDRTRCHRRLLEWDAHFADLPQTDVCGKCSLGPCALQVPNPA